MQCRSDWHYESAAARERRIFGGENGETESEEEADLKGPMLDVVLGLFDGLDYDETRKQRL